MENNPPENLIISMTLQSFEIDQRLLTAVGMPLKIDIIGYVSYGCLDAVETGLGRFVMPLRIFAKTNV